jgi:uncharacterized SAM-binding protein YcdF (DUF218 family)
LKLIIVFGAEKEFIGENVLRYERALSSIKNPEKECVCFTDCHVAYKMGEMAKKDKRILAFIIEPKARNTKENIEFSLPKFPWWEKIIFCSSWYHLPRIVMLYWFLRRPYMKKTKISILPVWVFNFATFRNALLEIPKIMLNLLSLIHLVNPEIFTQLKIKYFFK